MAIVLDPNLRHFAQMADVAATIVEVDSLGVRMPCHPLGHLDAASVGETVGNACGARKVWQQLGTRVPASRGLHRVVSPPGQSPKIVGLNVIGWRDGWISYGFALGRTAHTYCGQLTHLVTRSAQRGRIAMVLSVNLGINTTARSKKLRDRLQLMAIICV